MRHRKSFNHLGRKAPHRKAMLANMASSLIKHKRITTTTAKAKALRTYIEPLITRSKDDTTHSRRVVFSYLQDKDAVSELFREVAGKVAERPGGYTRIIKLGARLGDSAEMAVIELVDYNANLLEEGAKKPKSRRRRRGGGSAKQGQQPETATADVQDAEVVEEKKNESTPESGEENKAETTENVNDSDAETTTETAEEKKESPAAEAKGEEPGTEEEGQKKDEGENKGESDEEKKNS